MFKIRVDDEEVWGPSDFAIVFLVVLFSPLIRLFMWIAEGERRRRDD